MRVLARKQKGIDLDAHAKIVTYPHYVSKFPGNIFCQDRKAFVQLNDCKVCTVGRGA